MVWGGVQKFIVFFPMYIVLKDGYTQGGGGQKSRIFFKEVVEWSMVALTVQCNHSSEISNISKTLQLGCAEAGYWLEIFDPSPGWIAQQLNIFFPK